MSMGFEIEKNWFKSWTNPSIKKYFYLVYLLFLPILDAICWFMKIYVLCSLFFLQWASRENAKVPELLFLWCLFFHLIIFIHTSERRIALSGYAHQDQRSLFMCVSSKYICWPTNCFFRTWQQIISKSRFQWLIVIFKNDLSKSISDESIEIWIITSGILTTSSL